MSRVKTAYLFGSFNPPTLSHLYLAQMAIEDTNVERVVFIVSPENPEKAGKGILTSFWDRLEMTRDAVRLFNRTGKDQFEVSPVEEQLEKPSYTYKTIEHLREQGHFQSKDVILMGDDTYNNIKNWSYFQKLYGVRVLVFPRVLQEWGFGYNIKEIELTPNEDNLLKTWMTDFANVLNISSTLVRKRFIQGKSITGLVPEKVEDKIKGKNLFN